MQYRADSPEDYIRQLPPERQKVITKLRQSIVQNLPNGFEEQISYGMLGYVVPHSLYSEGYHCNPKLPLPFMNLASQKKFIGLYHMGMYANPEILDWFVTEYPKHCKRKMDMGKSCVRFKYLDDIPYKLIEELSRKMTPQQWIGLYERNLKNR